MMRSASGSPKVLTPITDRNGKPTHVWRNPFTPSKQREIPKTTAPLNSISVKRVPVQDALLLPRNPHIRVVPMSDGSKSLYVEARSVEGAIAHDVNNDLSYRLPVSALMDVHGITGEARETYDDWVSKGDLMESHFALLESLPSSMTTEDFISPLMQDEETQAEIRRRFFDPRSHGEKAVLNEDGSVAGYLYDFRDASDVTLEELRPDLVIDHPNADNESHKDYLDTEKYLTDYQGYEDDVDAGIRDDYFDDVVEHIKLYGYPKAGITRMIFFTEDSVIKIPMNGAGIIANANENRHANHGGMEEYEGIDIAENRLMHTASGMPYLVMQKVNTDIGSTIVPESWSAVLDGDQVGLDPNGKLVAYDL